MIKIIKADELDPVRAAICQTSDKITAAVADIIANVQKRGDDALRDYTSEFDGCCIDELEVPRTDIEASINEIGPGFVGVLERAAYNIKEYHRNQIRRDFVFYPREGVTLGQRIQPLDRVGIYIPGGTAAYPSCMLMNCIPAKLAGVREIILVTPPSKDGSVNAGILAAAKIAGADRVFRIGGAQAIAALAYGTESVPRVDKITGPGNVFVTEAKRQVFGVVGIDMLAGPSDILIIADDSSDPELVAADMLSQCEHGESSAAILVTVSAELAEKVKVEVETQLSALPRESITRQAVYNHSKIIIADSIDQAFDIANDHAPEHLEIFLNEPFSYLEKVKNAGSVFLGKNSPVALGDYYAGPNNTLPTSGTARFSSPLSVDDFIKKSSYTYYSSEALNETGDDIIAFAEKEGLAAHALSVARRIKPRI